MEETLMGAGDRNSGLSADPFNVVFCDDIRREVSGKDILIGVYGGDIVIPAVPTLFGVAFWIQFRHGGDGVISAALRITDPAGNTAGEARVEFAVGTASGNTVGSTGAMSLGALPISVTQPGAVSVYWSTDGKKFSLIGQKTVTIGPVATALAPPAAQPGLAHPG